jgi:hypothetical protein
MRHENPATGFPAQNQQAFLSRLRLGRSVKDRKVYPSIPRMNESIPLLAALDPGSALRAAKPRMTYCGI